MLHHCQWYSQFHLPGMNKLLPRLGSVSSGVAHLKPGLGSHITGKCSLFEHNLNSKTMRGGEWEKKGEACSRWDHLVLLECYLSNLCLLVIDWCFLYTVSGQVAVVILMTCHSLLPFVSLLWRYKSSSSYDSLKRWDISKEPSGRSLSLSGPWEFPLMACGTHGNIISSRAVELMAHGRGSLWLSAWGGIMFMS